MKNNKKVSASKVKQSLIDTPVNATIDQLPEWFYLAMSSYKMKKYGECLFAVSKAGGAISR